MLCDVKRAQALRWADAFPTVPEGSVDPLTVLLFEERMALLRTVKLLHQADIGLAQSRAYLRRIVIGGSRHNGG